MASGSCTAAAPACRNRIHNLLYNHRLRHPAVPAVAGSAGPQYNRPATRRYPRFSGPDFVTSLIVYHAQASRANRPIASEPVAFRRFRAHPCRLSGRLWHFRGVIRPLLTARRPLLSLSVCASAPGAEPPHREPSGLLGASLSASPDGPAVTRSHSRIVGPLEPPKGAGTRPAKRSPRKIHVVSPEWSPTHTTRHLPPTLTCRVRLPEARTPRTNSGILLNRIRRMGIIVMTGGPRRAGGSAG